MLSAAAIKTRHADTFTYLQGDLAAEAMRCVSPQMCCTGNLVFVSDPEHLRALQNPAIIVVHASIADQVAALAPPHAAVFSVRAIQTGMAALLPYFDLKRERFSQWGERHPTVVVHATAIIGRNVLLGPYSVIGAGASIGDDCMIGSHCVVENQAKIGSGTLLHPHVFVGSACEIGNNCEIHPHTSIGSDGFGYAVGNDGKPVKIRQLGNVNIGDDVEIGSNCAIDRATLSSTFIRSGTKLDNICHVAHNCDLGENGFFTAGFMVAGSTTIGGHFSCGGGVVVSEHLHLTDNVALAGRSCVTNDIKKPGVYGGYPLQPLKEALKTVVTIGHLNEIRKNLGRVMKQLNLS